MQAALERVKAMIAKLKKRHSGGRIGLLVPQPMASIVRYALVGGSLGDLWKSELDFGTFETLQFQPQQTLDGMSILAVV